MSAVEPLTGLGFDPLMAARLQARIERDLGGRLLLIVLRCGAALQRLNAELYRRLDRSGPAALPAG